MSTRLKGTTLLPVLVLGLRDAPPRLAETIPVVRPNLILSSFKPVARTVIKAGAFLFFVLSTVILVIGLFFPPVEVEFC